MNSIFAKKEKKNNNAIKKILSKNEIMSSVPNDAINEPDLNLEKTHIEIRWRIFKFPNISS